jgi:hypothetical protein
MPAATSAYEPVSPLPSKGGSSLIAERLLARFGDLVYFDFGRLRAADHALGEGSAHFI